MGPFFQKSLATQVFHICCAMFWVCCVEIVLIPVIFKLLPLGSMARVLGPERWIAQGPYVDDLISYGYDSNTVATFAAGLNVFIGTCLFYLMLRLIVMLCAPQPAFRINIVSVSIFGIALGIFATTTGINHSKGLYAVSTLKPLVVDEAMIFTIYFGLIVFAGELLAQAIALIRLQYADRWSV